MCRSIDSIKDAHLGLSVRTLHMAMMIRGFTDIGFMAYRQPALMAA
jgi:hypothetical protein